MFSRRTLLLLFLAAAAHARLLSDDPQPLGPRTPVVLIHGWTGGEHSFDSFQSRALADTLFVRRCRLYRFVYDWQKSIATSAELLRHDLDAAPELRGRPVVLVGHSMGGLVARGCAEGGDPDRVGALLTLGTPHHGSPAANLEWLRDDSSYWWASRLVPLGLMEQLNRIPSFAAALTEGGRDLGWDNYDGRMPERHRAGANRFLRDLNARFDRLPVHDELLLRYAFHASYLARVPALTPTSLPWLVHEGEYYLAGAALLAHAFRDGGNRTVDEWTLNDGIVPLDSAAFLLPGNTLLDRADGTTRLNAAAFAQRQRRPALVTDLRLGVDHTGLHADALAAQKLRQELERIELNGLALQEGGRITLYRPHDAHPDAVAAAPAGAELLAAPAPDLLLAVSGDALLALTPGGARTVARADGADGWRVAPDGRHTVTPDNALVGVTAPSYRRLIERRPGCIALWSPGGGRVALADPLGELVVAETGALRLAATLDLPPGSRPVAWAPGGDRLLCGPPGGLSAAAFRPDGAVVALLYPAAGGLSAVLCDVEGRPLQTLAEPPQAGRPGA
ncbi:MAG: hypothetical protein HYU66_04390, partial [Armatimonadetes bacterium]|nr:hypothetical protein [Armatimonadota bacterium]